MAIRFLLLVWAFASCVAQVYSFAPHRNAITGKRRMILPSSAKGFRLVSSLRMGLQVTIRIVGRKASEKWIEQGIKMYETRLKGAIDVETIFHKNDDQLRKGFDADRSKNVPTILMDPLGKAHSSEKFSETMFQMLQDGGSRLSYIIGGAEGLPSDLRNPPSGPKPFLMSLSDLTFTHQFARLVLIEQIYRACEIRKGTNYHK